MALIEDTTIDELTAYCMRLKMAGEDIRVVWVFDDKFQAQGKWFYCDPILLDEEMQGRRWLHTLEEEGEVK